MKTTAKSWMIAPLASALMCSAALAAPSAIPDNGRTFSISPEAQSVEDFAKEWRKVRKLMKACGAPDTALRPIAFTEGYLVGAKLSAAQARGMQVPADPGAFSFDQADEIEVSRENCRKVGQALRPILQAVAGMMQCQGPISTVATTAPNCPTPIFRAPRF